ncbi:hypothetical protein ACHQM5_022348 [Ranunculus cassubicifolius]
MKFLGIACVLILAVLFTGVEGNMCWVSFVMPKCDYKKCVAECWNRYDRVDSGICNPADICICSFEADCPADAEHFETLVEHRKIGPH